MRISRESQTPKEPCLTIFHYICIMDQPKIERILRLMKMLTANTSYSVDEMAERLDMSRRTIYRYIDTFREAGFVIKKSGNCIRLDKESPHFKDISQLVHFTEEEAVILKRAIESIDDTNLLKQNLKRKLYSVYDNKILADTIVRGSNAATVHALINAIEEHRQVILRSYRSSHGGAVRDRLVEPFAFTTNYVQVWCFDTDSKSCKLFKLARIDSVEVTNEEWQYESEHKKGTIDIFRMNGEERHRIRLSLGLLSHNLLIEEYPLAEQYLSQIDNERWMLDTEVTSYAGVARFVVGLMDDIRIIDTPELEQYLANYVDKYWPQAIKK
jgi:predicted DNA-binding transcriptional regulator YafY